MEQEKEIKHHAQPFVPIPNSQTKSQKIDSQIATNYTKKYHWIHNDIEDYPKITGTPDRLRQNDTTICSMCRNAPTKHSHAHS